MTAARAQHSPDRRALGRFPPTANCDKLAQRNLQITCSDNPGPPAGHRVPQTFDLRPSGSAAIAMARPDELMIDWGRTPPQSRAAIYWPQSTAHEVIALAEQLYRAHELRALDAHTVGLSVGRGSRPGRRRS